MGSPQAAFRTATGTTVRIDSTFNIRPGCILVFKDGALAYDGEAALAPAELMGSPGVNAVMHCHDKARLDAAVAKMDRTARKANLKPGMAVPPEDKEPCL